MARGDTRTEVIDRVVASFAQPRVVPWVQNVRAIVQIRRIADGEVRLHLTDFDLDHGEFLWSEGNYACDCNRAIFFYADQDDPERACGDTEFSVRIVAADDGRELYADDE